MDEEPVVSLGESAAVIKNVLSCSIGIIAYLRGFDFVDSSHPARLFPDKNFKTKSLLGIRTKGLVPKDENAILFQRWLEEDLFSAIENGYLSQVEFGIRSEEDGFLEGYTFGIDYLDASVTLSTQSELVPQTRTQIVQSAQLMVKSLIMACNSYDPLPALRFLTLKGTFTPSTPKGYRLKFFQKQTSIATHDVATTTYVGAFKTPFHCLELSIQKSDFDPEQVTTRIETLAEDERGIEAHCEKVRAAIFNKTIQATSKEISKTFSMIPSDILRLVIEQLQQENLLEDALHEKTIALSKLFVK